MIVIYIGLIIILGGIGIVIWLMLSERANSPELKQPSETPTLTKPAVTPQQILERVGLAEAVAQTAPKKSSSNPFSFLKKQVPITAVPVTLDQLTPQKGTKSLRLDNPTTEVSPAQNLSVESELSLKIDELQGQIKTSKEKYDRLDELFKEKSESLEKSEKALQSELKARKEFNKVKDLIEKELKDAKEKSRKFETDLSSSQISGEASLKRVNQLEEKIRELEKNILAQNSDVHNLQEEKQKSAVHIIELEKIIQDKNQKIEDLVKRMHDLHAVQTPAHIATAPSLNMPTEKSITPDAIEVLLPAPQESPAEKATIASKPSSPEPAKPTTSEPTPKGALKLAPDIFSDPIPTPDPVIPNEKIE